ncbi:quaternary ammonium compound efflux SMR transporter SugE [Pseudanabaena sp. FACHB-1277]|jgi:quaternary ammonium compound-resistance protein SugE|uniref:Quaternary ammonium compound efflux SMR transporter SugE n=1 Tax=Pseudanabaena cinerea FACHB-1277 TaxID=2949581 RepID=A0A926UX33_9CYAN|nr:quaternary ammonium compound efflux SMR transporter SugE [Pseudanabaena cinerea]MBD2152468.1 quaternary ammonium compound efflux SMR transporter SugE [Pseudanabaena cinerea FACHB-1277]
MDWFYLVIAGLLEVVWASCLKFTNGFTKLIPSLITISAFTASFILLAQALKTIPVGTGYAIWTGIGVIGTAVVGLLFLGEPRDFPRLLAIALIAIGIVGLRLGVAE